MLIAYEVGRRRRETSEGASAQDESEWIQPGTPRDDEPNESKERGGTGERGPEEEPHSVGPHELGFT